MSPFSIRHRKALLEKRLRPSLPVRLRTRLWMTLEKFNSSLRIQRDPGDSWESESSVLEEAALELRRKYGVEHLWARSDPYSKDSPSAKVGLRDFVLGCFPAQVLDVIEIVNSLLWAEVPEKFQREVNEAFEDEECPWRLSEGVFFQIDSEFLAVHVLAKTQELLRAERFQGALNEFAEARTDLQGGDLKDAVTKACKSLESALKTVLGREDGNASDLIRAYVEAGHCNDLPEKDRRAFGDVVLMALPFLGNRLGRHGQGSDVIEVTRPYAELAIHLAGSLVQFVVQKHLTSKPKPPEAPTTTDDDVPF